MLRSFSNGVAEYVEALRRTKKASKYLKAEELPKITKEQLEQIKAVWGDIPVDSRWIAHFNQFREVGEPWSPCYVPDNLQYGVIDLFYSDYRRCRVVEDQNLNDLLFKNVNQARTILRHVYNRKSKSSLLLDGNYKAVDRDEAMRILSASPNVICKPSIDSGGVKVCASLMKASLLQTG